MDALPKFLLFNASSATSDGSRTETGDTSNSISDSGNYTDADTGVYDPKDLPTVCSHKSLLDILAAWHSSQQCRER